MATVSVLNTDANITAKTLITAEGAATITGLHTFSRSTNPPFAVIAGAAVVTNLDADKLDGLDSTVFARWDGGGTGLGQIAFPAAQSASGNANVLDDYEEGNWTPVIGGSGGTSGQTYTTQTGRYVKVGQIVHCAFEVTLSAKGTITTDVQIQGLPFTSTATYTAGSIGWINTVTGFVNVIPIIITSSAAATLYGITAATTNFGATPLATADIAANTTFRGSITYRAAA